MTRIFPTLILVLCTQLALAAEERFPGIETLMTTAELREAGIETLSPKQLEVLNDWIERYTSGVITPPIAAPRAATTPSAPVSTTDTSPPTDNFGKAPDKIDFVSHIVGDFEGWSGNTRFTLENGQVWEQRRGGRWKISLDNPEVHIRENFMGAFEMEVLSEGRSIGVRRVR